MEKAGITLFSQLINLLPRDLLENIASSYYKPGNASKYSCWDQLVALVFSHLAGCDSLREIEDGLYSALQTINHARGAKAVKRTTLAYANEHRDYRIFEALYNALVPRFSKCFDLTFPKKYSKPTYAIDSTTITLCMKLFPWASYKSTKGGIKLHTALDLSTCMPCVMDMTEARVHDSKATREILAKLPAFSVVVMDRGYNDYELFADLNERGTVFVTRLKENAKTSPYVKIDADPLQRWGSYDVTFISEEARKRCDATVFRVVQWHDDTTDRWFEFLTNDRNLSAQEVADLYKARWQIELFFKKIKQNLKVKSFIGTSENAVMSQIWTAAIVTMLVEVLRMRSTYPWAFSRLFHFLRLNLFTFKPLNQWIDRPDIPEARCRNAPGWGGICFQQTLDLFAEGPVLASSTAVS